MGIPASGKSTFIRKQIKENGGAYVSRDEVRFSIITDEDDYFGKENLVFSTFVEKIQEAINNLQKEYTILIIAHRLSTVINCDRILFLNNGRIEAEGTHEKLLKENKEYKHLYESEMRKDK